MNPDDEELIQRMNNLKQVFRGDWAGAIMVMLRRGGKQYRELRDELRSWSFDDAWLGRRRSVSNGELARTLGRMVEDGLVIRTEMSAQWQPAVFYRLSDHADQVLAAIAPVLAWASRNPEFFAQAQGARATRRRGRAPHIQGDESVPSDPSGWAT